MQGVGLIGNGGLVCRRCYSADPITARKVTGRNPNPEFVFETEKQEFIEKFFESNASQAGQ